MSITSDISLILSSLSDFDYLLSQARLSKDFVEMPSRARPRPKSAYVPSPQPQPPPETSRATTKFVVASPLAEKSKPVSSKPSPPPSTGIRKARPLSADLNRVAPSPSSSSSNCNDNNELVLLLFLIGGREVGQVTVFKRPISIWRLDLTKTF